MIGKSLLKTTHFESPIAGQSVIKPKGGGWKRTLIASLMLTSLVDAFAILLLFLLSNYSNSGEFLVVGKGTELPQAVNASEIEQRTIVKVYDGRFFLEDKEMTENNLTAGLLQERKKIQGEEEAALIIQADKRVTYDFLSKIVHAGSQAGFGEIRFAVLTE